MSQDITDDLNGKRIAIIATDGFEQVELTGPLNRLRAAGAQVDIIAPNAGTIQGMNHHDKGDALKVDLTFGEAEAENYDCLVLPGGVANPDALRTDRDAVDFVEYFNQTGKTIAAICHGPWTLIEADMVRGRTLTSWPSLKTDLRNAGCCLGRSGSRSRC